MEPNSHDYARGRLPEMWPWIDGERSPGATRAGGQAQGAGRWAAGGRPGGQWQRRTGGDAGTGRAVASGRAAGDGAPGRAVAGGGQLRPRSRRGRGGRGPAAGGRGGRRAAGEGAGWRLRGGRRGGRGLEGELGWLAGWGWGSRVLFACWALGQIELMG